MSTPAMHLQAAGKDPLACETCGSLFTPKRGWARFCSTPCRNAFHAAEARKEAIRAAALDLYAGLVVARGALRGTDLEHVWINYPTKPEIGLGQLLDQVLGKLKPQIEPKALLEKAKA